MTTTQQPPDRRSDAWLKQARAKLLDLTMRNRALHFKVNKVSTVTIVDELPAEVFRHLSIEGKPMRFRAASATAAQEEQDPDDPTLPGFETADVPAAGAMAIYEPYATENLGAQHTDDWLQTNKRADRLDTSLRRIDELGRLSLEEQGVNSLFLTLGMLTYVESENSDVHRRAPLILVPATLERSGARAQYTVRAADDPLVNPSLVEYLKSFEVMLPTLPDSEAIPEGYDLQVFLTGVLAAIKGRAHWSVSNEIFLAPLSFEKLALYEDLGRNAGLFGRHAIIERLATRSGTQELGLPDSVSSLDLDAECAPELSHQVVDADASQSRAIAAVLRGHDLVIEGPPGTGKSQTITNLIAETLGSGKTVLFVAEKKAALDVVHRRLVQAGLGEFCLELHSSRANKRDVLASLSSALDAHLTGAGETSVASDKLPAVRSELTEYARAVHEPHGAIGYSPFRAYSEYNIVRSAPRARLTSDVSRTTLAEYDQAIRELDDLSTSGVPLGNLATHPFRDAGKIFYSPEDIEDIGAMLDEATVVLASVLSSAASVEHAFGLPGLDTLAEIESSGASVALVASSPGAPRHVLESDAWNSAPPAATELVARGRALCRLRDHISSRLAESVHASRHADDIALVERRSRGPLAFLAMLDPRYRSIRRRWLAFRRDGYAPSLREQAEDMAAVDELRVGREALERSASEASSFFGSHWKGEESSWSDLDAYISWVVHFRAAIVRHALDSRAIATAVDASPDAHAYDGLMRRATRLRDVLARVELEVGWPAGYLADLPLTEARARVADTLAGLKRAAEWAAFAHACRVALAGPGREVAEQGLVAALPIAELSNAFRRAFWSRWLSGVVQKRVRLEQFESLLHEERIREFRRLDRAVLEENRARLIGLLRGRTHAALRTSELQAALPYLTRQMKLQRRHAPLRRTMEQAGSVIRAIKPCFLMSPLTVAQLLASGNQQFDLVIFDEASQLPAEDAVGSICRGRQLAVIGDPKQLPPTNFFGVTLGSVNVDVDEDGEPIVSDAESVLEDIAGSGVASCSLLWHYRSSSESLIHFSNSRFYDGRLYTFPSVSLKGSDGGVRFEHVTDGRYEGGGLNQPEVRRVAAAVVEFARKQLAAPAEQRESLGVGTFNVRQKHALLDELERQRRDDPELEAFFSNDQREPFFVKNLETIQGDERDVIFISVTYGPAANGQIRYNFGPLSGTNGWRRLNVLTTRARKHMRVFSSMRASQMKVTPGVRAGADLLKSFLLYAETGVVDSEVQNTLADAESPFEREILEELARRGHEVHSQVGSGSYRIDIGVVDPEFPGRYLCGIECDGVSYHSSATARDRDRLRQQVLELRGWKIHRVWSTDWFKNRDGQIERIHNLIEATRKSRDTAFPSNGDSGGDVAVPGPGHIDATREIGRPDPLESSDAALGHTTPGLAAPTPVLIDVARDVRRPAPPGGGDAVTGEATPAHTVPNPAVARVRLPYVRPESTFTLPAPFNPRWGGRNILELPIDVVVESIEFVAWYESPMSSDDLIKAVAANWGTRAGWKVREKIERAIQQATQVGRLVHESGFYRGSNVQCRLRRRLSTVTKAEQIAPEEYRLAVTAVLEQGHPFTRDDLVTEVRTIFGYGSASAALRTRVLSAVDQLFADGRIGETASGLAWRER